jgi:hypothetical protein
MALAEKARGVMGFIKIGKLTAWTTKKGPKASYGTKKPKKK